MRRLTGPPQPAPRRFRRLPLRKTVRYPWDTDMTICIAARCQDEYKNDCFVFCCDREIQTYSARSESVMKMVSLTSQWEALIAGSLPEAQELVDLYREHMRRVPFPECREAILEYFRIPPREFRHRLAEALVQERFAMTYEEFLESGPDSLGAEIHRQALYDISAQNLSAVELILFGKHGNQALIYKLCHGVVSECHALAAIGSGAVIAEPFLFYRGHHWSQPIPRVLYSVYEAKRMSEITPGVGLSTHIGVYGSGRSVRWITDDGMGKLENAFARFGPQRVWVEPTEVPNDYISTDPRIIVGLQDPPSTTVDPSHLPPSPESPEAKSES